MRKQLFVCTLILSCSITVLAQKEKIKFQSSVSTGFIAGASGTALQLQTINGVKYKTWSAGIGLGLDYYHSRTIPLFIDVQKALSNKANTAFLYVDGGYNFRWLSNDKKESFITNTRGGLYYNAGIGYQFPVIKKHRLFFSIGYSGKHISNTEQAWIIVDPIGPWLYDAPLYHYDYKLQRLTFKAGLSL